MPNGRTLEQAEKQLAVLAEENRRLAAELDSLESQSKTLERVALEARAAQAVAEKENSRLKTKLETAQGQIAELQQSHKTLSAQVGRLGLQVEKAPLNPLTVEEASQLFDRVLGAFRTTKTLELREASLSLKLATAKLGGTSVLLVPEPTGVDPATLHELKVNLTPSIRETASTKLAPLAPAMPAPVRRPAKAAAKKAAARKRGK